MIVTLTGHDLVRIARALRLTARQILRAIDFYVPSELGDVPAGLRFLPAVMTERGPAYISLKKDDLGRCIFLHETQCLIYPVRPGTCTTFPFTFDIRDEEIVWGLSANVHICPGVGRGPTVSELWLFQTGVVVLEEIAAFRRFAGRWNSEVPEPTAADVISAILSEPTFQS